MLVLARSVILCLTLIVLAPAASSAAESCPVEKIIGAQLQPGVYKINVRRESGNLYQVTGRDIYIKTRMCLELALADDAVLEVHSAAGSFVVADLHFLR